MYAVCNNVGFGDVTWYFYHPGGAHCLSIDLNKVSILGTGWWFSNKEEVDQCADESIGAIIFRSGGGLGPGFIGFSQLKNQSYSDWLLLTQWGLMLFEHHPPKSSIRMFSGSTPRLSSMSITAWFIIGGPQI